MSASKLRAGIVTDRNIAAVAAWGSQLRASRKKRLLVVRRGIMAAGLIACIGATLVVQPRPFLIWNVSASAPTGLYAVAGRSDLSVGDMVIARLPEPWRLFAARRHYLPANVPLVKRVAAVAGDRVCAIGSSLWISGRFAGARRARDGAGRQMPSWSNCLTLKSGDLLLLMDRPDSFDGRYFGITDESDVVGRAVPLWTR
jgi:conjugative transfer signal peptidase TraF